MTYSFHGTVSHSELTYMTKPTYKGLGRIVCLLSIITSLRTEQLKIVSAYQVLVWQAILSHGHKDDAYLYHSNDVGLDALFGLAVETMIIFKIENY